MNRANPKLVLRIALVISYALLLIAIIFGNSLNDSLPVEVQTYMQRFMSEPPTRATEIYLVVGAPFLIGGMIAPIGLFFYKKWAAVLYIISGVGLLLVSFGYEVSPGFEPTYQHQVFVSIGGIGNLIGGFVIGLILFTDAIYDGESEHNQ